MHQPDPQPQGRDVATQHAMLQHAIIETARAAGQQPPDTGYATAALRNQEVQALTAIALELRELRITIAVNTHRGPRL